MRAMPAVALAVLGLVAFVSWSSAPADSVSWDVIAAGGVTGSNSTSYRVWASVGQTGADVVSGAAYHVYSGFWNPWLISFVGVEDEGRFGLPTTYQLSQNYPNPFGPETTIRYGLPTTSRVVVEVFNLRGQRIRLLARGTKEPGYHFSRWDGRDAAGHHVGTGIYLCRLTARAAGGTGFVQSREMLLVK